MTDHDLLVCIQECLDGHVWNADTLETIANIMIEGGYKIRDLDDREIPEGTL